MISYGPDHTLQADNTSSTNKNGVADNVYMLYDSTNGTKIYGDIWRLGP